MALRRKNMLQNTPFPKMYPRKWEIWCKEIKREMAWLNKYVPTYYLLYDGFVCSLGAVLETELLYN